MLKSRIYYLVMISLFYLFNRQVDSTFIKLFQDHINIEFYEEKKTCPANIIIVEEILNKSDTIAALKNAYLN